jgi:hypothetical protein
MSSRRSLVADVALLVALMAYILVGTWAAPPHGDEYMQMSMARDVFYLLRSEWDRVWVQAAPEPDTEPYLRLLNGSLNKTLIGILWWVSGQPEADLPDIYAWGMTHAWNVAEGRVPSDAALQVARWPSSIMAALGVLPMFWLGWQVRRRSMAYPAAILYALHPALLLNGRRAMLEGSLSLFTLLVMAWALAMIVAEHSAHARGLVRRLPVWGRFAILGALCGFALSAKHTGIVVSAAALISVLLTSLARRRDWGKVWLTGMSALVMVLTFLLCNPGYWRNPLGTTQVMIAARAELLSRQTADPALAYTGLDQRLMALVVQPFLAPPQYFEAPTWGGLIDAQTTVYERSSWDGWTAGTLLTWGLTGLAILGMAGVVVDSWRGNLLALALAVWLMVVVAYSLTIPLNWGRYYLPLVLIGCVLAAHGLGRLLVRRGPPQH